MYFYEIAKNILIFQLYKPDLMASRKVFAENERQWLAQLAKGNITAFDHLYWHYQQAVFQNAFKLTKDAQAAEDITQEVFIKLWEKKESLDITRSVGGWLFVSSYNRSISILKNKLRAQCAMTDVEDKNETDDTVNTELQFSLLEKAMSELSPQKRKVIELCKLRGYTYEEAAREMNISRHTVKEYLCAAVHSIKEFADKHPAAVFVCVLSNFL